MLTNQKQICEQQACLVAFQGIAGAYGEQAALQANSQADCSVLPQGYPTFHEVFAAVVSGEVELGVVPVENSLMGAIHQTYDLLLSTDLHIAREVTVRVKHHLLALPGVQLHNIRRVYSQPPALSQCDGFIAKYNLLPVATYDTAGAARDLAERGALDEAVIASGRAGELYGLESLATEIEDEPFNFTRFFVLSRQHNELTDQPYKTSIVFGLRHNPGALVDALSELSGLNLTKIESRPRKDRAWSYVFYVDFEGDAREPQIAKALIGLMHKASFVKILGSYPKALEVL